MQTLEHKIPPPVVALVTAAAMWGIAHLNQAPSPAPSRVTLAIVLAGFGLVLITLGIAAFATNKTTINPVEIDKASVLVTNGVFRYTRNPMYTGLAAILFGWAFYLNTPLAFLGPPLFALFITRFQIMPEERVMREKFASAYSDYARKVRRWF